MRTIDTPDLSFRRPPPKPSPNERLVATTDDIARLEEKIADLQKQIDGLKK